MNYKLKLILNEKEITEENIIAVKDEAANELEKLIYDDYTAALGFVTELCKGVLTSELSRPQSAAAAAVICRFLLAKKNKSRLPGLLQSEETIRRAVFGRLNTNKYSLIFLFKRLLRLNDPALTRETLELMINNPFCEKEAKPWSDRWSLDFIIAESLKAPEDYLCLTKENEEAVKGFPAGNQ